jgi:hypothetical protein
VASGLQRFGGFELPTTIANDPQMISRDAALMTVMGFQAGARN